MRHFLILTVYHDNQVPKEFLEKALILFDKKNKIDLESDNHVTLFPETKKGKGISVHFYYEAKDFKSAVYDVLVKANQIAQGWTVTGPIKMKKNVFMLSIHKEHSFNLPDGVNGIAIMLNSNFTP